MARMVLIKMKWKIIQDLCHAWQFFRTCQVFGVLGHLRIDQIKCLRGTTWQFDKYQTCSRQIPVHEIMMAKPNIWKSEPVGSRMRGGRPNWDVTAQTAGLGGGKCSSLIGSHLHLHRNSQQQQQGEEIRTLAHRPWREEDTTMFAFLKSFTCCEFLKS